MASKTVIVMANDGTSIQVPGVMDAAKFVRPGVAAKDLMQSQAAGGKRYGAAKRPEERHSTHSELLQGARGRGSETEEAGQQLLQGVAAGDRRLAITTYGMPHTGWHSPRVHMTSRSGCALCLYSRCK